MVVKQRPNAARATPTEFLTRPGAVTVALQPVVELQTGAVVGYEALARVAGEYPRLTPMQMFAWARCQNRLSELDWICRCAAFRTALAQGITSPTALLVNVEPAALDTAAPPDLLADLQAARRRLRIVVELTERDLARNPVQLFRVVASMRALGWEIALDDVGAEPVSLALLPLLEPDIIKLDRSVIVDPNQPQHTRTLMAVAAEAERTSATVIAEGIETPEQLEVATSAGARFGQGFLLGRPSPRVRHNRAHAALPRRLSPAPQRTRQPERCGVRQLLSIAELSRLIDRLITAATTDSTAAVMCAWPATGKAVDTWRAEFARLTTRCAFVGSATTADNTCQFVLLGSHTAAAVYATATALPDSWETEVTYRLDAVIAEGQHLAQTVVHHGAVLSRPLTPEEFQPPRQHTARTMHYA